MMEAGCYGAGHTMASISSIAQTATLIGDLTRASMFVALKDGRALTASELVRIAGIAPQTATGHLSQELSSDSGALTEEGDTFLCSLGVDLDAARHRASNRGTKRMFCRPYLDWSERRSHIGGALGAGLCQCYFDNGWIRL